MTKALHASYRVNAFHCSLPPISFRPGFLIDHLHHKLMVHLIKMHPTENKHLQSRLTDCLFEHYSGHLCTHLSLRTSALEQCFLNCGPSTIHPFGQEIKLTGHDQQLGFLFVCLIKKKKLYREHTAGRRAIVAWNLSQLWTSMQ